VTPYTIPFACVLLMYLLVLGTKLPLAYAQWKQPGGYATVTPRVQQDRLEGFGARARGAHYNTIEAFPPFAVGVIVAYAQGLDAHRATVLCVVFVIARVLYPVLYLLGLAYLRSAVWTVGVAATLGLFVLPWL
jgi:uncharacterized MAPEG superfamily protein